MSLIGHEINGNRIIRMINSGGMAIVYEAENSLGIRRAVKVLDTKLSQRNDLRIRFQREAKILAKLKHPNIVEVLDYKDEGAILSIVMELLKGEDLQDKLDKGERFSDESLISLFTDVLEGFKAAHNSNIFHRDIKPANIFLTDDGKIKILDFGISKIVGGELSADLTTTREFMGSPAYMSPEHVKGIGGADKSSDIYALGVTLWAIYSGKSPFSNYSTSPSDFSKIISEIENDPLPIDHISNRNIRRAIEISTQKDPELRFKSIEEFIDSLKSPGTISSDESQKCDVIIQAIDFSDNSIILSERANSYVRGSTVRIDAPEIDGWEVSIESPSSIEIIAQDNKVVKFTFSKKKGFLFGRNFKIAAVIIATVALSYFVVNQLGGNNQGGKKDISDGNKINKSEPIVEQADNKETVISDSTINENELDSTEIANPIEETEPHVTTDPAHPVQSDEQRPATKTIYASISRVPRSNQISWSSRLNNYDQLFLIFKVDNPENTIYRYDVSGLNTWLFDPQESVAAAVPIDVYLEYNGDQRLILKQNIISGQEYACSAH